MAMILGILGVAILLVCIVAVMFICAKGILHTTGQVGMYIQPTRCNPYKIKERV